MEIDNRNPVSKVPSKPERMVFRQPLAVALICLVFIGFFLLSLEG